MVPIRYSQIRPKLRENVRNPCFVDNYFINVVGWVLHSLAAALQSFKADWSRAAIPLVYALYGIRRAVCNIVDLLHD